MIHVTSCGGGVNNILRNHLLILSLSLYFSWWQQKNKEKEGTTYIEIESFGQCVGRRRYEIPFSESSSWDASKSNNKTNRLSEMLARCQV